jgi:uncharacterized protein with HEPN domain
MFASNNELLRHIQDETDFVLNAVDGKEKDAVINNPVLCRAIIRSLEIIGEAATKLDIEFKAKYPHVEWKKMAGTRSRLIHDYFGVDYDIVWNIIQTKLPDLQFQVANILKEADG